MENFNTIPSAGTYGSAIALINANFSLTKEQLERLSYSREGFCGMYETDDDLESAYPHPTTGSFAYVGTSFPMTVYLATNGVWAASSSTYSGGEIDLTQYADEASLTALAGRVTALENAGYVFIGIATPAGAPSPSQAKRFALAWAAGTYTYYGGFVLNSGEMAVLMYNGSAWSGAKTDIIAKSVVGGYDTTPTEDSEKPITSGGVYTAMDELRSDMEDELSNVDMEFGSGEHVSDVVIHNSVGQNESVLLTQGGITSFVFNEIDINDIDNLNNVDYAYSPSQSQSKKTSYYTVVTFRGTSTTQKVKIGTMAVISDGLAGMVTEVMTTRYTLDASGNLTGEFSNNDVFTIYRSMSGNTWTQWHYVNESVWSEAINSIRTDLTNYYTKSQTYSRTEVDNLIAAINQFEYIVVNSLPYPPSANTMRKIYLIPSAHSVTQNVKDEYITIQDGNSYKWEQIGSTAVDMSGYSTTAEMNTAINAAIASALISYYTKTQVDTLLDEKQDVIDDLSTIRSGAAAGATAVQPAAIANFATMDYVGEAIDDAIDAIPVDDNPTAGSTNLVKSGGVYPTLELARQNCADISVSTPITASETVTGKYIKNDGSEQEHSSYQYQKFSVEEDHLYTFSAKFIGGDAHVLFWFDSTDELISYEPYLMGEDAVYSDVAVSSPQGASYAILNELISQSTYYQLCSVGSIIKSRELKESADKANTEISDARGDYFIYTDCIIKVSDGTIEEGHPGINATDFLPITGKDAIIGRKLWTNGSTIAMIAFYDAEKNFISAVSDSSGEHDVTIAVEDIPEGATFIRASANFLREGPHTIVGGVDLASIIEYQSSIEGGVLEAIDAVTQNICTQMAISNTLEGGYIKSNGEFMEHTSYHVDIYNVDGDNLYAFSGSVPAGANLYFLSWFDENSEFIKIEPYHGSTTEATSIVNQVVKSPSNAVYLYLNVLTSRSSFFNASSVEQQIIKSADLKEELDGIKADAGIMKVTIQGDNISVRTALNNEKDLIIKFGKDSNGNISPKTTLIGNTDDYDAEFVEIHKWSDSTMPLRSVPQFWHLYAAHGIPIPLVTVTDNPLTSDDVGSWWQDQENRQYQVGKVLGNKIYLIPRVVQSGTQGIVTRDWRDATKDTYPSELQHVSGAVHTDTLTVASASQYQVEPIQASSNKMLICDGKVVSDGTYFCNEFVVSETLTCLDVTAMTSYFPTPTSLRNALVITNSFIFKGLSIGFNQLVNCVNPVQFGYYGSNQAQHLADTDELDAYVLIPKVKKNNSAGSIMNRFFRSQDSDSNVTVYRTTDDLVDIDKLPDRQLSVLKDGSTPLIGFASGVSLVRGVTVDEVRNTFIAKSSGNAGNALLFSPTNNNKFYVGVVSAYNTAKFTNQLMQTDFCKEFSTYYSYFMPTGDVQTYWYYDGTSTIIYIHAESNTGRVMVDVSKAGCEGMGLEIIEKTEYANLYSDSIINGKVCVAFSSADANYIVLKTK